MAEDVTTLFDDYAARFARGERPSAREYLGRAGEGSDELARLIEVFLARASPPAPDEDARTFADAWVRGEAPLHELRLARGLRVDEVVASVIRALRLDPDKEEKVKRYYHALETGLLEPRGVDRSVWNALSETFHAHLDELRTWRPRPVEPGLAFYRASDAVELAEASVVARPPMRGAPAEQDEIDRLFTGADTRA